jgi:hypothetical protein
MEIQEFQTTLDPDLYFKGLARQSLDFHAALGELVDNSFSARRVGLGGVPQNILIEITVEQLANSNVCLQVADSGIGISLDDITSKVFNLGGERARFWPEECTCPANGWEHHALQHLDAVRKRRLGRTFLSAD